MHIHDSKGKSDHLPLLSGDLNYCEVLQVAKLYNCNCVLEIKTIDGLTKSVNILKSLHWKP